MAGATLLTSSCNDWLDVLPKNEQVSPEYWKTKEQVEELMEIPEMNERTAEEIVTFFASQTGQPVVH